jgi:hypothetical protein
MKTSKGRKVTVMTTNIKKEVYHCSFTLKREHVRGLTSYANLQKTLWWVDAASQVRNQGHSK